VTKRIERFPGQARAVAQAHRTLATANVPIVGEPRQQQGPPPGLYRYAVPVLFCRDGRPLDTETFLVDRPSPVANETQFEDLREIVIRTLVKAEPEAGVPRVTLTAAPYLVRFIHQETLDLLGEADALTKGIDERAAELATVSAFEESDRHATLAGELATQRERLAALEQQLAERGVTLRRKAAPAPEEQPAETTAPAEGSVTP
jgi:hypothetical protein